LLFRKLRRFTIEDLNNRKYTIKHNERRHQENLLSKRDEYRAVGFLDDPKLNQKQKNLWT
jgi:hypothetical protein